MHIAKEAYLRPQARRRPPVILPGRTHHPPVIATADGNPPTRMGDPTSVLVAISMRKTLSMLGQVTRAVVPSGVIATPREALQKPFLFFHLIR